MLRAVLGASKRVPEHAGRRLVPVAVALAFIATYLVAVGLPGGKIAAAKAATTASLRGAGS